MLKKKKKIETFYFVLGCSTLTLSLVAQMGKNPPAVRETWDCTSPSEKSGGRGWLLEVVRATCLLVCPPGHPISA